MWCRNLVVGLVLASTAGCTGERLRQRTIDQGGTLPELQYQQVLDNLALLAENPSALPWHVNLKEGTTQITDSASGGAAVDLGPPTDTLPQLFASRTVVAQWGMAPVIDPLELRLLRVAYRRAHGSPEMPPPEVIDELAYELKSQTAQDVDLRDESELYFEYQYRAHDDYAQFDAGTLTGNDEAVARIAPFAPGDRSPLARDVARRVEVVRRELARVGPGWFHVGSKHEVPKDACYVGRHGDRYAWVCADGREALTEFTLTVMRLSTLIRDTQTLISPGSVKFSPGDR